MSPIEEIQDAAVDSNSALATLLRKCKLLAAWLSSQPLEDWVLWESNGYPDEVEVPNYRIWRLEVKGQLFDPFGKEMNNVPIPLRFIPERARDRYRNYKCQLSVATIEETLRTSEEEIRVVDTGSLADTLGRTVSLGHYRIIRTWAEFGKGNLIELLNAVRNRILDFTIAVRKEALTAGEQSEVSDKKIEPEIVTQIFNNIFLLGPAINSPIQQGGAHANMIQSASYSREDLDEDG